MIAEKTSRKIDRTFDALKPEVKHKLFQEIKDLGLKIEYRAESWSAYMLRKAKMTQGKLSKLYALFAEFEKDDVNVFLNAFSEVDKPLEVPIKRVVCLVAGIDYYPKHRSDLELQLMMAKSVKETIDNQVKQALRGKVDGA